MIKQPVLKTFTDSYLYRNADYSKGIFDYIMTSEVIDKDSDSFSDILYQVKIRQTNPVLMKVLQSDKIVLCIGKKPMPRPFKVFRAANVRKSNKEKKVYIDCTDIIVTDGGLYKCKNIAILLSYIIDAMSYVLYFEVPNKVIMNNALTQAGTEAFVDMMLYVMGYMKVPVTYSDNKEKIAYVVATYYQRCILCKQDSNTISQMARKISKLDQRKCEYLDIAFNELYGDKPFVTINEFIEKFAQEFLNQQPGTRNPNKLTIDLFMERWMYAFGPGTYLGLEFFPAFAAMLTDCYVGGFVNQQNTIEKIVGSNVAQFTNTLLDIGSDNA